MRRLTALLALFMLLCSAACKLAVGVPDVSADSVELSPSVQLIGKFDWEIIQTSTGDSWSRCLDMVWRAVESGSSCINFVPTHHWLPDEAAANGISGFCYMDTVMPASEDTEDSNTYKCYPWSQEVVKDYTKAMQVCFAEALRQGLTIYVRPHLDDGTLKGAWRNGLLVQPQKPYGEFSYYDIMLAPLADALYQAISVTMAEETIKPPAGGSRPHIYFAMQGEMSATIMRYASEWSQLVDTVRQRIAQASDKVEVKIGIGLNFNRLDDTTSVAKEFGSSRLSWLAWQVGLEPPAGTRDGVPQIDVHALRRLFNEKLDFLGISAYAPYNIAGGDLPLQEFENSAFILCDEMLSVYGIDIKSMANTGKMQLHYSEFGIGGGSSYGGGQIARTPAEVALRPFFGVYGPYSAPRDPWSIPANNAFRKTFYYRALQWLADPGIKTHQISNVFVWSMASWDVLGVYPESTNGQGSYKDPDILAAVKAYNAAVRNARAGAEQEGSSIQQRNTPSSYKAREGPATNETSAQTVRVISQEPGRADQARPASG